MYAALFSVLFLLVGLLIGVLVNERYREYVAWNTHEFDKIFKENPHPEIYDKNGKINKEDYLFLDFGFGYDADDFDSDEEDAYI